jgi:hypothetical protein
MKKFSKQDTGDKRRRCTTKAQTNEGNNEEGPVCSDSPDYEDVSEGIFQQ